MSTHTPRLALVAMLLLAVAAPSTLAAAESVYEADAGHDIATQSAKDRYHDEGHVTGDVYGLNMTVTVADKAGDTGLSDLGTVSTGKVFVRVDYNEELERTVRFYLPASYVAPQLKEGLESDDGSLTADLKPTENRSHTAMTMEFDGRAEAVFAISVTRGAVSDSKSGLSDILGNMTGFELPSLTSGGAEWHYVSGEELDDNQTDYISANESDTIQYNAAPGAAEAEWTPVQTCDGGEAPVCTYTKADYPNRTYLLSQEADPPRVRYRSGSSVTGGLGSAINDAVQGAESALDGLGSLFGGDE